MRCRSCTFCTFLLAGSVVVVEDCGVQDTELALLGVRDTELEPPSSSDPGQLLPGGCSRGFFITHEDIECWKTTTKSFLNL